MLDMGDPAIKLFGKTIPLLASDGDAPVAGEKEVLPESESDSGERRSEEPELEDDEHKEASEVKSMDTEQPDEETQEEQEMLEMKENSKIPDTEDSTAKGSQNDEKDETKNSQQRPMKKPDKILPCPRCNSMDTKFCYYNNYNVNQPRHFCKSCQRYWTAGGTMRNVPVGAGRRKNKSSASRYCHITVSEALQAAQLNGTNGVHHPTLKSNGTVLTFGTDSPLCESMASVLNIGEKQVLNGAIRNGIHKVDRIVSAPCRSGENGDDQSSGSAITTTSSMEESAKKASQEPIKQNLNGFPNQVPCFQWPYVWNPAVPVPPFCTGYPMSFYPAPYWNGAIPWNVPWLAPCSPGQKSPSSNPSSPTLGKHSRDGEILQSNPDAEKNLGTSPVLVPKTLRIYDPDEAAKSSIWTTLGIKNEKGDPLTKGGFFNRFQSKTEDKSRKLETSPALKANPAALCRSINFKETA